MWFRERQQTLISITAIMMIGLFLLIKYLPVKKRLGAVIADQKTISLAVERAVVETKQLPALKKEFAKLDKEVEDYDLNIPGDRELGAFLQLIADLMNEHNLSEQQIQPAKEIEENGLSCIPVNMRCAGKLADIFEFYKSVQNLDRIVRLEHFQLENDKDISGAVRMEAQTVIYYRQDNTQG
jgi:Tfp pilus assembly protein PilO